MSAVSQAIYDLAPAVLQNAMISTYGLHLRRIRYGGEHASAFAGLLESQWDSPLRIAERQGAGLSALLKYAKENTEFYARIPSRGDWDEIALRQLPIVTKEMVQSAGTSLIARPYRDRKLQEIHTGGTTGKPMTVYCTSETLQRNYAFFRRFQSWSGFQFGERVATFAGRNLIPRRLDDSGVYWRFNRAASTLLLSSYHLSPRNLPGYVRALAGFRPALIDSYPSSLISVAQYVLNEGIREIRPKAIITSSETLEPEVRDVFERAFACPVFDHYGAAEMAAFITQCEHGAYHVNPEFGIVELLDEAGVPVPPGEIGEIVATGFVNQVMPLIRYATGDLAVKGSGLCTCGRSFAVVDRVLGRRDDVIVTPDGRRIGRLDPVFKVISGVFETQIVQTHRDRIRVEIVPTESFRLEDAEALRKEIERRVGKAMTVEVVRVNRIARAKSGKLRTVVNLIDGPRPTDD